MPGEFGTDESQVIAQLRLMLNKPPEPQRGVAADFTAPNLTNEEFSRRWDNYINGTDYTEPGISDEEFSKRWNAYKARGAGNGVAAAPAGAVMSSVLPIANPTTPTFRSLFKSIIMGEMRKK